MTFKNNKKRISWIITVALIFSGNLFALESELTRVETNNENELIDVSIKNPEMAELVAPKYYNYTIKKGDNLSYIFNKFGFKYTDLVKVMEVDLNYLSLDTIQPGTIIQLWKSSQNGSLMRLQLKLTPGESFSYTTNGESYSYATHTDPGEWKEEFVKWNIITTLSGSAKKVGLKNSEISEVVGLFGNKIDFTKELRKGDEFKVIKEVQYIKGKKTRNTRIKMVSFKNNGKKYQAILHSNGQFYDENGKSLEGSFDRTPVENKYIISSGFNPTRKHPVTGRVSPHNGTDFATPSGTKIKSVGDGTVILVLNHPYAGKYIVIRHSNKYKTRYLHMSKSLVKKGDKVKRGDIIGLSGSTGRVTGAHLHYELLINDRAVNAMTAKIPEGSPVPKSEMSDFLKNKKRLEDLISQ